MRLCNVRCDIDVSKNGIVNVVVVVGIDVGATVEMVAVDDGTKLLLLLSKIAAIVDTSMFVILELENEKGRDSKTVTKFKFIINENLEIKI